LDVFEDEPNVRPELVALDNVVLTPHIGGGTSEALAAMSAAVVANVNALVAGKPLPNEVI
jgi:lactate dehydrogenase-like 2-hydroxyacid dehydrogenase